MTREVPNAAPRELLGLEIPAHLLHEARGAVAQPRRAIALVAEALQALRHPVRLLRDGRELVAARDADRLVEAPFAEAREPGAELGDGPKRPATEPKRQREDE